MPTSLRKLNVDGCYFEDAPRSGLENMAIDQCMLQRAASDNQVLLRIYEWAEPTLSLGYFQTYDSRATHAPSQTIHVVRRASGGGAIVHHHEWTYSLAVPDACISSSIGSAQPLYDCVHDAVVDWLSTLGLPAAKWQSDAACQIEKQDCAFLCFERRSVGDVVVGSSKVMGSAQRRLKGGLLQHGSLLLRLSEFAPSLRGVDELSANPNAMPALDNQASTGLDRSEFSAVLIPRIEKLLKTSLDQDSADKLSALPDRESWMDKYAAPSWLRKR